MNKILLILAAYVTFMNACEDGHFILISNNQIPTNTYKDEKNNLCTDYCPLKTVENDMNEFLCIDKCEDYPGFVEHKDRCQKKCPIGLKTTYSSVKCVPSKCKDVNQIESDTKAPILTLFKEARAIYSFFYKYPEDISSDFTFEFNIRPKFVVYKKSIPLLDLRTSLAKIQIFLARGNVLHLKTKGFKELYTALPLNSITNLKFVLMDKTLEVYMNETLQKSNSNFKHENFPINGVIIKSDSGYSDRWNPVVSDINISNGNYTLQPAGNTLEVGCITCPPKTVPSEDRSRCIKCVGISEISINEMCVSCDPLNQIELGNECVRCDENQAIFSNKCVDCGPGRTRSKITGLCINQCPGNSILGSDGVCTKCPETQFSYGDKCVTSCPNAIEDKNFQSSEGCVSKCSSGLQFPAGTCYEPSSKTNTCPSAAPINLKGVCSNSCPEKKFISYDYGTGINNGKGDVCTSSCRIQSKNALGKNLCQWNYCPSSSPYLWTRANGEKICQTNCRHGVVDGASQTCPPRCKGHQTLRNVSSTYLNVCKSKNCDSDSLDLCPLSTSIPEKLPNMFGVKPVRYSIAYTFAAENASCDSNILFDSIATFINDPRIANATSGCGAFNDSLICAQSILNKCLLSSGNIGTKECRNFVNSIDTFGYSKLFFTLDILSQKSSLLKKVKRNVLTINAVKIVINTVHNLLNQKTTDSGINIFKSPAEFYLVLAVLTRFIQNYDITPRDPLLLRRVVEWAHLSFFSMDDIANMYLSHTYSSATTYLFDMTSSSNIQFKRGESGISSNDEDIDDFDKRLFTSTEGLANLVAKATSGCSINKLPDSAMGCLSVGMYLSKSVDKASAIIAFDAIFANSIMGKIYENCAGWSGNDWDGITGRDAPYNQNNCNNAIYEFCNTLVNKNQDPLCVMANVIVNPFFSELAPKKCPNGYPCMPQKTAAE